MFAFIFHRTGNSSSTTPSGPLFSGGLSLSFFTNSYPSDPLHLVGRSVICCAITTRAHEDGEVGEVPGYPDCISEGHFHRPLLNFVIGSPRLGRHSGFIGNRLSVLFDLMSWKRQLLEEALGGREEGCYKKITVMFQRKIAEQTKPGNNEFADDYTR